MSDQFLSTETRITISNLGINTLDQGLAMKTQQGSVMVEYIAVVAAIFITWNIVDVVRKGIHDHQLDYLWSLAQPVL